jgi:hypothetical protein
MSMCLVRTKIRRVDLGQVEEGILTQTGRVAGTDGAGLLEKAGFVFGGLGEGFSGGRRQALEVVAADFC